MNKKRLQIEQLDAKMKVFSSCAKVAMPPKRHNNSMSLVAKGYLIIGRNKLLNAQLAGEVISKSGYKLVKPKDW